MQTTTHLFRSDVEDGNPSPFDNVEEQEVIFAAIDSFHQYRKNAHYNSTHRRRQNLYALPSSQWRLLADPPFTLLDTLNLIDDAIDVNADLADEIVSLALLSFGLPHAPPEESQQYWQRKAKPNDMSKAHSTLRQFYRDWSEEGYNAEVKPYLEIILTDLERSLPPSPHSSAPQNILLPGAGLGRLLFDLCCAGYSATGNEISYHQLIASNLILNHVKRANQHQLFPFATTFTNNVSRQNQLKCVTIPDVHPATAMHEIVLSGRRVGEMSMTAGDFVLSYSGPDSASTFDAVVSVFFIDTAPNLIRYIETVHNCLGKDGIWINIGPLLWHFDDRVHDYRSNQLKTKQNLKSTQIQDLHDPPIPIHSASSSDVAEDTGVAEPGSFELANEEVILLLEKMGFKVETSEIITNGNRGYGYIQDPESMLQSRYRSSHWIARKITSD